MRVFSPQAVWMPSQLADVSLQNAGTVRAAAVCCWRSCSQTAVLSLLSQLQTREVCKRVWISPIRSGYICANVFNRLWWAQDYVHVANVSPGFRAKLWERAISFLVKQMYSNAFRKWLQVRRRQCQLQENCPREAYRGCECFSTFFSRIWDRDAEVTSQAWTPSIYSFLRKWVFNSFQSTSTAVWHPSSRQGCQHKTISWLKDRHKAEAPVMPALQWCDKMQVHHELIQCCRALQDSHIKGTEQIQGIVINNMFSLFTN